MQSDSNCCCDLPDPSAYWEALRNQFEDQTVMLKAKELELREKIAQVENIIAEQKSSEDCCCPTNHDKIPKVFKNIREDPVRDVPTENIMSEKKEVPSGFFQKVMENAKSILSRSCTSANCPALHPSNNLSETPTRETDASKSDGPDGKNTVTFSSSADCLCESESTTKNDTITDITPDLTSSISYYSKSTSKNGATTTTTSYKDPSSSSGPSGLCSGHCSYSTDTSQSTSNQSGGKKSCCICTSSRLFETTDTETATTSSDRCDLCSKIENAPCKIFTKKSEASSAKYEVKSEGNYTEFEKTSAAILVEAPKASVGVFTSVSQKSEANTAAVNTKTVRKSDVTFTTQPLSTTEANTMSEFPTRNIDTSTKSIPCRDDTCSVMLSLGKSTSAPQQSARKTVSQKTCTVETCLSFKEMRSKGILKDVDNQCAFVGSPILDNTRPEAGEKASCCCCTSKIKTEKLMNMVSDLSSQEKDIKCHIEELLQREKNYDNMFNDFQKMLNKPKCTCQPNNANDIDKISQELKLENKQLKSELMEMKLELKHCLEKIEGPMQHKLETEKCKCILLQQELNKASQNMLINQDTYMREMNSLKLQLCMACSNMTELNTINKRLKDELNSLDCMCVKLEEDLIKQKLSEAETIRRLSKRTPDANNVPGGAGSKASPSEKSSQCTCDHCQKARSENFKCDSNLHVIARKLSKTLRESAPCEECAKLPSELKGAAKCIRDLTDLVESRKADFRNLDGETRDCSCQSPPETENLACQCTGRRDRGAGEGASKMTDKQTPKLDVDQSKTQTLFPVRPTFTETGDSSQVVNIPPSETLATADVDESKYYTPIGSSTIKQGSQIPNRPCPVRCEASAPCYSIGMPCGTKDKPMPKARSHDVKPLDVIKPAMEPCPVICDTGAPCYPIGRPCEDKLPIVPTTAAQPDEPTKLPSPSVSCPVKCDMQAPCYSMGMPCKTSQMMPTSLLPSEGTGEPVGKPTEEVAPPATDSGLPITELIASGCVESGAPCPVECAEGAPCSQVDFPCRKGEIEAKVSKDGDRLPLTDKVRLSSADAARYVADCMLNEIPIKDSMPEPEEKELPISASVPEGPRVRESAAETAGIIAKHLIDQMPIKGIRSTAEQSVSSSYSTAGHITNEILRNIPSKENKVPSGDQVAPATTLPQVPDELTEVGPTQLAEVVPTQTPPDIPKSPIESSKALPASMEIPPKTTEEPDANGDGLPVTVVPSTKSSEQAKSSEKSLPEDAPKPSEPPTSPEKFDTAAPLKTSQKAPFEENLTGDFPFDAETTAEVLLEPPPELTLTTTITSSGNMEVITEGAAGVIETSLNYLPEEGIIEVVTVVTELQEEEPKTAPESTYSAVTTGVEPSDTTSKLPEVSKDDALQPVEVGRQDMPSKVLAVARSTREDLPTPSGYTESTTAPTTKSITFAPDTTGYSTSKVTGESTTGAVSSDLTTKDSSSRKTDADMTSSHVSMADKAAGVSEKSDNVTTTSDIKISDVSTGLDKSETSALATESGHLVSEEPTSVDQSKVTAASEDMVDPTKVSTEPDDLVEDVAAVSTEPTTITDESKVDSQEVPSASDQSKVAFVSTEEQSEKPTSEGLPSATDQAKVASVSARSISEDVVKEEDVKSTISSGKPGSITESSKVTTVQDDSATQDLEEMLQIISEQDIGLIEVSEVGDKSSKIDEQKLIASEKPVGETDEFEVSGVSSKVQAEATDTGRASSSEQIADVSAASAPDKTSSHVDEPMSQQTEDDASKQWTDASTRTTDEASEQAQTTAPDMDDFCAQQAAPKRQKRDCACQSHPPVSEQSCQCCECKDAAASTSHDSETNTDQVMTPSIPKFSVQPQQDQSETVTETGEYVTAPAEASESTKDEDIAEAGTSATARTQGTTEDVSSLTESQKARAVELQDGETSKQKTLAEGDAPYKNLDDGEFASAHEFLDNANQTPTSTTPAKATTAPTTETGSVLPSTATKRSQLSNQDPTSTKSSKTSQSRDKSLADKSQIAAPELVSVQTSKAHPDGTRSVADRSQLAAPERVSAQTSKIPSELGQPSTLVRKVDLENAVDNAKQTMRAASVQSGGLETDSHSEGRPSSGSEAEKDPKKKSPKKTSEVPDSVSKLSDKAPPYSGTPSDSKKTKKKRSSKLANTRCVCPEQCQCVVCCPEVLKKRKDSTGSYEPPSGKTDKICCCAPQQTDQPLQQMQPQMQPQMYMQPIAQHVQVFPGTSQMPQMYMQATMGITTAPPMQTMMQSNPGPSGNRTRCIPNCECPPKPGTEAFLRSTNLETSAGTRRRRISIDDVYIRPDSSNRKGRPNEHPPNCECVDCICSTVQELARTKEFPVLNDEKQVYQVHTMKCTCPIPKSKIPISTNPSTSPPKVKSSPSPQKQLNLTSRKSMCNCGDCECKICFGKTEGEQPAAKKPKGKAMDCCCKGDCTCEPCPSGKKDVDEPPSKEKIIKTTSKMSKQPSKMSKKASIVSHPEDCDCKECVCPKSKAVLEGKLPKSPSSQHPPDCDCDECVCPKSPAKMGKVPATIPEDCDCGDCVCPKSPLKKKDEPKPPGAPIIAACDCSPCECDPCADPKKRKPPKPKSPASIPCDCKECECDACPDPNAKAKKAKHADDCKCDKCTCLDRNKTEPPKPPVSDDCLSECLCDEEIVKTTSSFGKKQDDCDCDVCSCPSNMEEPPKMQGCTCEVCTCPGAVGPGVPPTPRTTAEPAHDPKCVCDICKCAETILQGTQPEMTQIPSASAKPKPPHMEGCTCAVCTCPGATGTGGVQTAEAIVSTNEEKATHPPECICKECLCAEQEKHGEGCPCPECKCEVCIYRQDTGVHSMECKCGECRCTECPRKIISATVGKQWTPSPDGEIRHARGCNCDDCRCTECYFDREIPPHPTDCVCDDCICTEGPFEMGDAKKKPKDEPAAGATKAPIPPPAPLTNRSCHCIDCTCDVCGDASKKKKDTGTGPSPPDTATTPGAPDKPTHPDIATTPGAPDKPTHPDNCTCIECVCIECMFKKTKGTVEAKPSGGGDKSVRPATAPTGQRGPDCKCTTCVCSSCGADESGRLPIPPPDNCFCVECKCTECGKVTVIKSTPDQPGAVVTFQPGAQQQGSVAPQPGSIAPQPGSVAQQPGLLAQQAQRQPGTDPPPFEPLKRKSCDCKTCTCIICREKAGYLAVEPKTGDAPPFQIPTRLPCNCPNCKCVTCNHEPPKLPQPESFAKKSVPALPPPKQESVPVRPSSAPAGGRPTTPLHCYCPTCTCVEQFQKGTVSQQERPIQSTLYAPNCKCTTCLCPQQNIVEVANAGVKLEPKETKSNVGPVESKRGKKATIGPVDSKGIKHAQSCTCAKCTCGSGQPLASKTASKPSAASGHGENCKCSSCCCQPCDSEYTPSHLSRDLSKPSNVKSEYSDIASKPSAANEAKAHQLEIKSKPSGVKSEPLASTPSKHPAKCDCCKCKVCADEAINKSKQSVAANSVKSKQTTEQVDISQLDDATLVKKIQSGKKENCECREQIKEIRKALNKIKCACNEAEMKAMQAKPLVKQASAFGQTMSGLKLALQNLQEKCKAKDRMIEAMTGELKTRTSSRTLDKVINTPVPYAPDYDKGEDVRSLGHSKHEPPTNILYTVAEEKEMGMTDYDARMTKAVETEKARKHKKKSSKVCKCGKSHKFKDSDNVDLSFEIIDIRRITDDSIIVKWKPPNSNLVVGYDIYVNGVNKSKVMSGGRTSAMVHCLDLSATIQITIYAVTKCGRCEPPAIAIYEIKQK